MAFGSATWGRFLRHGLISGTVTLALLVLGNYLLRGGGVAAWLLLYAALVVPPALAARRFAPKEHPRRHPSAMEEAERAVTSYGEQLRQHPYAPGPSADPGDLEDYRTALEIYDQATRSEPAQIPKLLERGRAALGRLDAAGLAGRDISWTRGAGSALVRVPWPAGRGAALLVFESDHEKYSYALWRVGDVTSRLDLLLLSDGNSGRDPSAPVRARVLVPRRRGGDLLLDVLASGHWRIALRPAGEMRRLEQGVPLTGQDTETVLRSGASRVVEFEHHDDGAFRIHQVTRSYRTGRLVARGRREARLSVAVPERCVLRIEAVGRWTLRDADV